MDEVKVDTNGYVWISGKKICRLTEWGQIEFYDGDKLRSSGRGSNFIYASAEKLIRIFSSIVQPATEIIHESTTTPCPTAETDRTA